MSVVAESAQGELRHVELAQADRARLEQPARRGALGGRGKVSGDTRAARGRQPLEMAEILEPHGNAVERPVPSARRRAALERARPPAGALSVAGDDGWAPPLVPD